MLAIISKLKNFFHQFKSTRVQSLGVLVIIGIIPLIIFSVIFLNVFRSRSISQRVSEIQVRGNVISNLIVGSGYLAAGEPSEKVDTELSQVSDMYDGRILIIDSRLKVVRDTYGLEEDGSTLSIYLSREDLANLSNMTTSNAIRTLSQFATERLITIDGRKIKIIEEEKLKKISKIG